ncbi:unnamed protein product [Orchesella dallaii]|uniref:Uncharacterized protein n=1 Tax=Orchesella dallaii TaxID=48710 RepID=A0ABP1Q1T3_9HEXA
MSLSCSGTPRGFQDTDEVGMPFIDDLLWGPDNDGKLIDLGCLDGSSSNGPVVDLVSSSSTGGCNTPSPTHNNVVSSCPSSTNNSTNNSSSSTTTANTNNNNNVVNSHNMNSFMPHQQSQQQSSHHFQLHQHQQSQHPQQSHQKGPNVVKHYFPGAGSNGYVDSVSSSTSTSTTHSISSVVTSTTCTSPSSQQSSGEYSSLIASLNGNNGQANGNGGGQNNRMIGNQSNNQSSHTHDAADRIIKQEISELPLSQLSQADLNGLVSSLDDDDSDLFDHLSGPAFEIDAILDGIVDDSPTQAGNGNNNGANNGSNGQGLVSSSQAFGSNAQQQSVQQQHQQQSQTLQQQQQQQFMNYQNGGNMSHVQQQQHHHNQLDVDQRSCIGNSVANNNKKRKKPMKLPGVHGPMETVSLEEAAGNILPLANLAQQQQSQRKQSILQSQLCDAHGSMDGSHRNGKANIAAANPLLAEKLAAPMSQGMNDMGQQNHRDVGGHNSGSSDNGSMKAAAALTLAVAMGFLKFVDGSNAEDYIKCLVLELLRFKISET